jgi:hypothetical protein
VAEKHAPHGLNDRGGEPEVGPGDASLLARWPWAPLRLVLTTTATRRANAELASTSCGMPRMAPLHRTSPAHVAGVYPLEETHALQFFNARSQPCVEAEAGVTMTVVS